MLAAVLSFLSTPAVHPAPFNGDSDGSTRKSISSSSTVVAKWVTSDEATSFPMCGTRRGFYTQADVYEHYDNLALNSRS